LYHKLLADASLYGFLFRIDLDLAKATRAGGCRCGGRLHSARYPRKPRGGPADLDPEYARRASFCCAVDGCRGRVTPPSVRFLGRRVYLGAVVVLGAAMMHGVTPQRAAQLRELLGASRRTLGRWQRWWREVFVATAFWRGMRGHFVPAVDEHALPGSLLERFDARTGDTRAQLIALLHFLGPLTTSSPGTRASLSPGR